MGYPGRWFSLVDRAALNAFVLAGHTVSRFLTLAVLGAELYSFKSVYSGEADSSPDH